MEDIRNVYPDLGEEPFYGPWDYNPLIRSFGHKVIVQVDDEDYQGDTRILFEDGGRVGYLIFGWGSCSGCDALQDCNRYSEIDELRDELASSIRWFEDASEALGYFRNHDWVGDFSWHADETKKFVELCIAELERRAL